MEIMSVGVDALESAIQMGSLAVDHIDSLMEARQPTDGEASCALSKCTF